MSFFWKIFNRKNECISNYKHREQGQWTFFKHAERVKI